MEPLPPRKKAEQSRAPNPFAREENRQTLEHYVIYERPKDYPDKFVVRRWVIKAGNEEEALIADKAAVLVNTLEQARAVVPQGLYRIPRAQEDDPVIVETWI